MKKFLLPIFIILFAAAVAAVLVWQKKEPGKHEAAKTALLVETVALKRQDLRLTVLSQGNVMPRTETTLVSEISGVVMEVSPKFVAGGFFAKGEVLLRLNPVDYEVALEQARANLLSMQAQLTQEKARAEQAVQEWALSGRKKSEAPILALRTPYLEEAKANVLFAEANLKNAQRKLELTWIRVPYEGMVKSKLVDMGQYVSIGTQLANTIAVDFAEVRLPLTDTDIAYLELPEITGPTKTNTLPGPDVELTGMIGGKDYHWNAQIVRTEGVVDQRTRVHFAVARIVDPYGLNEGSNRPPLSIGSYVKAKIYGITVNDVIGIPRYAVRGVNQVLIMDTQDRLRLPEVDIVFADENYIYVKDGVSTEEYAVVSAIEEPVAGMNLRHSQ